ncbi:uncharacterized protein LOC119081106 [Bradysia coprophila]|uniref:uncharacterized protein LOC119081106 n=1 Tax=Bradysia coprophila TaxID=38358 RepID=UPI00187D7BC7|nr:uncharacterized protein LOC119081106 [Bradysia coprophila]
MIAVKSSLPSERIVVPGTEHVEVVFVKLNLPTGIIYLACVYIPSGSTIDKYNSYADALRRFFDFIRCGVNDSIFVMGDFNMTDVVWSPDAEMRYALLPGAVNSSGDSDVIYSLLRAGLSQVNSVKNKSGSFLDLVFTSDPSNVLVRKADIPLSKVDRDYHYPIECTFDIPGLDDVLPESEALYYDYKNADFHGLSCFFANADWERAFSHGASVDDAVEAFDAVFREGCERFVPRLVKRSTNRPPWYTDAISNLKNRMNRAFKRFKNFSSSSVPPPELKLKFLALRKEFQEKQSHAYDAYIRRLQFDLTEDPRKFWKFVDSKKKTKGLPASMFLGDEKAEGPEGVCALFSRFFRSVYVPDESPSSAFGVNKMEEVYSYVLTDSEVLAALRGIDVCKGNGPDDVSPLVIKNCAESLLSPLSRIFNFSLGSSVFPARWKSSYLTPIHKSGSRSDVSNYRGIAILATLGKLFESLVCKRMADDLSHKVSIKQHGFLKGRSTTTNLLEFVTRALHVIESKSQVDAVYTDIQKAFDQVRHSFLIQKLGELGIQPCLLNWIESYLRRRFQFVRVMGHVSESFEVTSGLPQGSHLGPLLFILYFDDVTKILVKADCGVFADDLKLYHAVSSLADAVDLQKDIDAFEAWCHENRMAVNVSKCKVMSFYRVLEPVDFAYSIGGAVLTRVSQMVDLGVLLDTQLTFKPHVGVKVAKAYSMLGFLKRLCAEFADVRCLTSLYSAHVRSHLEYASVVWSPSSEELSSVIESVQKSFVLYALRRTVRRNLNYELPPYDERRKVLRLERLSIRRKHLRVFFLYDVLEGRVNAPRLTEIFRSHLYVPEHSYGMRRFDVFRLPCHRTSYGHNEPVAATCREFEKFIDVYRTSNSREIFRYRVKSSTL